ncbi:MAG: DUF1036 domain-containing protein [Devosia sp.]|uniref:DUF1036 domain-containing protein n=1 Tax=Devosia sp. TaxID=1871048 RepID=UPI001AC5C146|nr:DUF1036 domain-containing protein [Devosia sp.]MBN9310706.1 DUF1036 domain-containing protein [Devosia sp.]MBN9317141.1 DUF1036 domain-containing protein [Devosia sp.]
MRYILAIAGVLAAAFVAASIWAFLPRTLAPQSVVAQEQAPAPNAAADTSQGSFRVCNETANKVSIAFGYRAEKGWQSEGWWVAEPSNCVTIYRGDLEARRYYYLYAADDVSGGAWDGNVFMCTRDETFTIFGVEDCLARGYERTGFFEVDTHNRSDWTLQLTEGEVVGGEPDSTETVPLEGDLPTDGNLPADGGDAPTDDAPTDEGADIQ